MQHRQQNKPTSSAAPQPYYSSMDLSNPPDESKVSLLTIPRAELGSSATSPSPLMLLQLPANWSVSDLKAAHFVAQPSQQAALVVESKRCSFSVHRVETSNALVMVPPPADDDEAHRALKKSKVTEVGKTLTVLPARLLKMGGAGACFLELREKKLSRIDLLEALEGYLLDPYNNNSNNKSSVDTKDEPPLRHMNNSAVTGRTVADLAATLQCSKYEVEQSLKKIQAYALPRTDPPEYCLLAEEALQECYSAIVAALAEADGCDDYAGTGVNTDDFVTQVVERMLAEDEKFPDVDFVIRHCLQQLRAKTQSGSSISTSLLQLDVSKVRNPHACIA